MHCVMVVMKLNVLILCYLFSGNGEVGRQNGLGHREGGGGGISKEENGESGQTNSLKRSSSHDIDMGADQIGRSIILLTANYCLE